MKRMRFGIAAMRFALVFSVLLCGAMNRAHADVLIASDSYATGSSPASGQYATGTSIATQPGLVTTGFATGGYANGAGNTSNFVASATGLSYAADGANASTGSVAWIATSSTDTATKSVAHNLSSIINESSSSTYWVSELMKNTGNQTTTTGSILSGFANATSVALGTGTNFLQGVYFGFADNSGAANEADLVARYRDTSGNRVVAQSVLVNGANNATADTTYLVVAKITVNSGLTPDTVNYWINPTDLSSQAALTSTALTTGTLNTLSYQGGTSGDFTRLNYVETNWDGGAFFDEARLGTTLASIAPVPEPSSMVLLGVGSIAALVVRSRRRARVAN